jgi:hypothetical protein
LDPRDALKYLEAISGEIDQIKPRDRSRFALLMYEEAKLQPDRRGSSSALSRLKHRGRTGSSRL